MKKTIEELAWEYIQSIADTYPNTDISLFKNEYNAFMAGANAVKNNVDLADVVGRSEQLKAVEKLKDFAYEVCPLHREDDLEEIVGSL